MNKIEEQITSEPEGSPRRYDVELFIRHPSMSPDAITAKLGLQPTIVHPVGERRKGMKGQLLEGNYTRTAWRHSVRHTIKDQWFADEIDKYVDQLLPHKSFLQEIRSTGGDTCVSIQFLGDGYLSDQLAPKTLAKLADLGVDFGMECFVFPQSE